ncbi:hypothetical protein ACTS9T_06240 [Empedobacter falsenii]|uniref:Tetratricopeptide repeat protein n=1 Tax=Empedobacter falsenii TaxID=343874 RepID=A0A376J4N5_9FLAO|nr:hypothetical protein [Empedobacter falsenii]STE54633.1 Uncharacterised protein [Empedobacter falsenii]
MNHKLQILKPFLSFFILFIGIFPVFAQKKFSESILKVENLIIDGDYNNATNSLNKLLEENSNQQLNKVIIYINYVNLYANRSDFKNALKYTNLAKEISDKTTDKLDDVYTLYALAKLQIISQQYDKTIYYSNKALKILNGYSEEYLLKSKIYQLMSVVHSYNGIYSEEYENYINKAFYYAKKSGSISELISVYSAYMVMYFNKYQKTNDPKDLDKIFENAENSINYINQNTINIIPVKAASISYNNLASVINNYPFKNLSNSERYNLAEKYINIALNYANKINNTALLATCYATYAEIMENKGNDKQAEKYYLKAYQIIKSEKKTNDISSLNIVVKTISNFYEKNNEPSKALKFNKEALIYTQKAYEKAYENKRNSLEAFYNFERKNEEIKQLTEKNKIFTKQRILYLVLIAISIIGIVFMVYMFIYKQKLNKQKTNLLEAEKQETALTLKLELEEKARLTAERKLMDIQQEQLQKKALATSLQLNNKNSFITELKEKIKEDKNFNINKVLKDERLTDSNFTGLQTIVQDIHPNFFKKMNEISQNRLSTQDLNYAAFIYLNMDNQQISNLLKVENKTVRMTKYRLKQKLGLGKDVDLQKFIQSLEL